MKRDPIRGMAGVWANIGRRTVLWILPVSVPLVIGVGWVLNGWVAVRH